MSKHWKFYLGVVLMLTTPALAIHAQTTDSTGDASGDASAKSAHRTVYHVNYWIDGAITVVGGAVGELYLTHTKSNITDAELNSLNANDVPSFDRISLHQKMSLVPTWDNYASVGQVVGAAIPLLVLADNDIRPDWLPVLTIGLEVNMVAVGLFGTVGPRFIDRYRPLVYYSAADASAAGINRNDGINKSSFYSGHVASVTASSFFVAKVFCDYHPDANPYLVYGLAAVPSLGMGVIRFMTLDHFPSDIAVGLAVGVACGVVIPQLHRIDNNNVSLGFFSTPQMGTGLSLAYTPSSSE